jgi:hypothetical protein
MLSVSLLYGGSFSMLLLSFASLHPAITQMANKRRNFIGIKNKIFESAFHQRGGKLFQNPMPGNSVV